MDIATIRTTLTQNNLKATRPRIALLQLLEIQSKPVTIENLYAQLKDTLNKTTLYRTLDQLVTCGIVYQTHFRDGRSYFELQKKHHHHIICTECGHTEAIEQCVPQPKSKTFASVTSHMLEFFGRCTSCQV